EAPTLSVLLLYITQEFMCAEQREENQPIRHSTGQSDSPGWRVRRYTHSGNVSDCSSLWGSVTGSTCTIGYLYTSHTGVYWCQSESGGSSNPVNITVHNGDVILESSVHPVTVGDPLTLHCLLRPTITSRLRADLYKDGSLIQTQTAGEITIHNVSKSDEGVYYCKHPERGESPHSLSPPVSLIISPSRTQHFSGDSLSLSCEGQSDSTGWRVRRYTHSGSVSDCSSDWGSVTGSTCTIRYLHTSHTGVYWCQSESGGSSNPVNITVHNGDVILESSVHPVTEGDPLTLHCLLHLNITSHLRADLYKDGSLIQTQTAAEITIRTVSKSDEGVYYCKHPERGDSPHSWVSSFKPRNVTVTHHFLRDRIDVFHIFYPQQK
uniref:Ig-like domain-containing protein n=1 Tax=Electrophorus electricus TaxID=8005 RepID=A0AAY5F1C7_ELEEL